MATKCYNCNKELKQLKGKHKLAVQLAPEDNIIIVDGKEGMGMSSMAIEMEKYFNTIIRRCKR